jgi:hypothetical protein
MIGSAFGVETADEILVYRGASDASAAAAIGKEMFVVADDENNVLRVYKTSEGGLPIFSYDMADFLDIEPEHPEADIEGATTVGQRIYWITSHGRNKDGKMRPNRYRFFATDVKVTNGYVAVNPAGRPYKTLIHNLVRSETARHLELDKVTRLYAAELSKKQRQKLAPKENGLNIEGLCASADGETLYIGFRNPRPIDKLSRRPKALVIPLNNPRRVVEEGKTPIFGELILWDLAAYGIRSMEYSHFHKAYFIIAGSYNENRKFALYRWSGKKEEEPVFVRRLYLSDFTPEALCVFPNSKKFFVLSDDGTLEIKVSGAWECIEGEFHKDGTCLNKYLIDPEKKAFRGIWLKP